MNTIVYGAGDYVVDFTCKQCGLLFTQQWTFGDTAECPDCDALFETDYETDAGDTIKGPWLATQIKDKP